MVVKAGTCSMSVRECFIAFQTCRKLHTSQVFPRRAPAGKKETGNTKPLGDQGGWAVISQPFPSLLCASHLGFTLHLGVK